MATQSTLESPSALRVFGCSYAAATGALLINFPFDTIKTLVQAAPEETIPLSIKHLYQEGGVRAFYRGVSASLVSSSAARAMSMGLYNCFVPRYAKLFGIGMKSPNDRPTIPVFFSGLTAGAFSCILTGPFEFTKTASQVESVILRQRANNRSAAPSPAAHPAGVSSTAMGHHSNHTRQHFTSGAGPTSLTRYSSTASYFSPTFAESSITAATDAGIAGAVTGAASSSSSGIGTQRKISALQTVRNLRRRGGWAQLYGGVEYHCLRDSIGSAIYFTVYETTKRVLSRNRAPGERPNPFAVVVAGGMCGAASWLAVYPIDTMKSEYQRDLYSRTLIPTSLEYNDTVVRRPKFRFSLKMYRGLGFSLMRTSFNGICLFSLYEYFMWVSS